MKQTNSTKRLPKTEKRLTAAQLKKMDTLNNECDQSDDLFAKAKRSFRNFTKTSLFEKVADPFNDEGMALRLSY